MSIHKIIPYEDIDFWPKIYLIFYPSFENLTTHITIPAILLVRTGKVQAFMSCQFDSHCNWYFKGGEMAPSRRKLIFVETQNAHWSGFEKWNKKYTSHGLLEITCKQAEWLACRKSRDPTLNAVCWEDAGSKIQFSLISVYKKMWLTTSKSWFGWKHGL